VVAGPELILADEPTGSVDAVMAERLLKLFQSLNRLGTTVLIASHDEALAARSGATRCCAGRRSPDREAPNDPPLFPRRASLLPRDTGGEPWLAAVIAVLCFLACLSAVGARGGGSRRARLGPAAAGRGDGAGAAARGRDRRRGRRPRRRDPGGRDRA
jgi:hypothetical protein